jgi:DNA-binding transcriptional LysR family regulator
MDNWDEVRTAYQVARLGTVSGAAEVLGVHHATVIRHIDALENRLGVRLFQRHARGYTPTEAGQDLLRVAATTDEQFSYLVSRLRGQGDQVAGELVITALSSLTGLMMPVLDRFRADHPQVILRFLTGDRLFRLEYGEAHIAIRAGTAPDQPDNVVQPFFRLRTGLYCTQGYADRYGQPAGLDDLAGHRFVGEDDRTTRAPFYRWMWDNVPPAAIVVRTSESHAAQVAVLAGLGVGFLPVWVVADHPDLVEISPPLPEWDAPLWLVTHVDLHRTAKVQAFLKTLKDAAASWT